MPPDADTSAEAVAPAANSESAAKEALIAELDAEDSGGEAKESQAKEADGIDAEAEAEDDVDDTAGDEGDAVDAIQTAEEIRQHVKDLVAAGDLRKVEEALGLEKGALKLDGAKFRYMRQRAEKAAKAEALAQGKHVEATALVTRAQEEYGPMVRAKQLFAQGTAQGVQQAARFVEAHFGVPLTQFVEAIVKAGRGESQPARTSDPEIAELKTTVQRLLQEREQQQLQETARAAATRHVATIKSKLGSSPIAKLPDAANLVYERLKGSYDRTIDGYTLTLPEAIKAVTEDPATKWRLHEMRSKSAPRTPEPVAVKTANGSRKPVASTGKLSPKEKEAAEKAAVIAELEAQMRKEERAQRSNGRR